MATDEATVLVVDDEREVADVYALRLSDHFETETAYGGHEALDVIDDEIDVVLLDRRMPDLPGDEVLDRLREDDVDCRVIMITAVDPDFDIIDMDFEDYLCKPIDKDDLVTAIEQQLVARRYDERLTEYLEVRSKLALLESQKGVRELEQSEDVEQLRERARQLKAEMDDALGEFEDIEAAFESITRQPG